MKKHKPDFNQLLKVIRREIPDRDVLYEFFFGEKFVKLGCGSRYESKNFAQARISAFAHFGYDYSTAWVSEFNFPTKEKHQKETISLNDASEIFDRESFDKSPFLDPDKCDYTMLKDIEGDIPAGMKLIPCGPCGVLENVIRLVGYDNLCMMLYDDPQLVYDIFEKVGGGLVGHYRQCCKYKTVGAIMSNDDWGFNTQTMLSPADMRKYVFPWHKKIVETAHAAGLPIMLHSCGYYGDIVGDLYALGYDARHSYEDNIEPVEKAYERFRGKIAVLGGIDLDFVIRSSEEDITARCKKMLETARKHGGYALGTGNSVPDYVPVEKYLAMLKAIKD